MFVHKGDDPNNGSNYRANSHSRVGTNCPKSEGGGRTVLIPISRSSKNSIEKVLGPASPSKYVELFGQHMASM
ncbi:hypothetical protein RRG08_059550, partial [Elysia crispata]